MELFGAGIVTWDSEERKSKRYGHFYLSNKDYKEKETFPNWLDTENLVALDGSKVTIYCKVLESRKSGHIGDLFLSYGGNFVRPKQPQVNDLINVGTGYLHLETAKEGLVFGLKPDDGREQLWIDPLKLYEIHDQTVELWIEETESDCSKISTVEVDNRIGAISDGEGGCQVNGINLNKKFRLRPKLESVDNDLYRVIIPQKSKEGEFFEVSQ